MAKAKKKAAVKKPAKPVKKKAAVIKKVAKPAKKAAKPVQKASAKKAAKPALSKASMEKWGLHPLADRVIVQVQSGEKMTAGGLYIPDTTEITGNLRGTILAAGNGGRNKKGTLRPLDVKAGDTILFSQFVGEKMNIDGLEVQVLREAEILGIVEK